MEIEFKQAETASISTGRLPSALAGPCRRRLTRERLQGEALAEPPPSLWRAWARVAEPDYKGRICSTRANREKQLSSGSQFDKQRENRREWR